MSWTPQRLTHTISLLRARGGDSADIELKRAHQGFPTSIAETLCAFANMPDGGTMILGIDEKRDFEITGVYNIATLEAAIASTNREHISPHPHLEFESLTLNEKNILIVTITGLPITEKPAVYKGKAYLRQSDGDYAMNDSELKQLEIAKLHSEYQVAYDETAVSGTSQDDLDPDLLAHYLASIRASSRRLSTLTDQEILHTTRVTQDNELTLAGLYALGKYPQGAHPALHATAAVRFKREYNGRTKNLRDFDGPLPEILADLLNWVQQNLPTHQVYQPATGELFDKPAAPLSAVRELIANALVHRDLGPHTLGVGKSVQICITDKGLFIENPGGLRGISLAQLTSSEHAQAAVNPRLYNMVKHLRSQDGARIIEGEGGSIREVLEAVRAYGLIPPSLINSGVKFKAVIWFEQENQKNFVSVEDTSGTKPLIASRSDVGSLGKNAPAVVRALEHNPELSMAELVESTGLTRAQLRYALSSLLTAGLVQMVGEQGSRNTRYTLLEG